MAAQRTYTATFAIGAKLAGSFRGVMAAAQSRLKTLEHAAMRVGRSIAKLTTMFGGLGAILGAFGVGKILTSIFEGADEAAEQFETRQRKIAVSLLNNQAIAAKGLPYAEKQRDLIEQHNAALAQQGVISKGLLDTSTANLAMIGMPPKYITEANASMADLLVVSRGVNATQEDMATFSKAYAVALRTGMTRGLRNYGIVLSDTEAKQFKDMKKSKDFMKLRFDFLMKHAKFAEGQNVKAAKSDEGRIHKLTNDLAAMRIRMGLAALPLRAKMADEWRKILPQVEPILTDLRNMGFKALGKVAQFVGDIVVPAFKTLSAWWKSEGGKAFMDMMRSLGKAFVGIFRGAGDAKKSMSQIIQERMLQALKMLTKLFEWIGKNAKWLVPTILTLVAAFAGLLIALQVAAAIAAIANPVGLIIVGIGALVTAVILLYENWDKIKEMFPTTAAIVEHFIEGFKLSFMAGFDFVKAIWKTLVAIFTGDFTGVGDAWAKVWKDIVALAQWWEKSLIAIAKAVGQAFKDYFLRVFEDIKSIWTWMKGFSWSGIKKMFAEGKDAATAYGQAQSTGQAGGAGGYAGVAAATAAAQSASAEMPLTPEALKAVQAERASVVADLQRPELRNLVSATLATEAGGAEDQKNILEALVNRGVAQQRAGTYKGVEHMIKGGFYGPYNRGETNAVMARGLSDARSEQVGEMIKQMGAGRNALGGLTDQGMVNEIKGNIKEQHGEDYFGKLGIAGEEQTAAYRLSRGYAHGGIITRAQHALLGERGPEAVIPLSGGRRAEGLLSYASRALGIHRGGATHVNFTPSITINGNASNADQASLDSRLRALARDFVDDFKRAQSHERRLSYEGGYG
jgi:carbon monoxide dehydrogenase subunit G